MCICVGLLNGIFNLLEDEIKLMGMGTSPQNFSHKVKTLCKSHYTMEQSSVSHPNDQKIEIRHFARKVIYSTVSECNIVYLEPFSTCMQSNKAFMLIQNTY